MKIVILLVVVCIAAGLLWFVVGKSPIPDPYKGWIQWVILAIAVFYVIACLFNAVDGIPRLHIE